MTNRTLVLAAVLAAVPAGRLAAQTPKKMPEAEEKLPTPKKAVAEIVLKNQAGKEVQRLKADTSKGDGAQAICAYAEKEPSPDTLAFAVVVEDKWQVRGQIEAATSKKPKLEGVSIALADKEKSILSWSGGPDACKLEKSTVAKNGDVKVVLHCEGIGAPLGSPTTMDAKLDLTECPKL